VQGISFFIHWTFLILIFYIIGSGFMEHLSITDILYQLVFVLSIFVCVSLHELGHALAAARFGIPTQDITLLPIGGVARLFRMPEKPSQELVVAVAGPFVNVIIALLISVLLLVTGNFPSILRIGEMKTNHYFVDLLIVNLTLIVFNLIPAFPMDGGRVLRALLSMRFDRLKSTKIAAMIGQTIAVGFVLLGFYGYPSLLFIGIFIFIAARNESSEVQLKNVNNHTEISQE
jgi:Zn-dependent protease